MNRLAFLLGMVLLAEAAPGRAQAPDKAPRPKAPPAAVILIREGTEGFLKRFDRNGDGTLSRDEVPPFLAKTFDKVDGNQDGKLDRREIEQLRRTLIQRFGANAGTEAKATPNMDVERLVDRLLQQQDSNQDGKISKAEARGRVAQNFDKLDTNKDGILDRAELRRAAAILASAAGGQAAKGGEPDFDALDRNADGRLSREELQGTPFASRFDEIDTNRDGQIDRREFEAFLKKSK